MGNLAIYATKGFEYLLILGFLVLFTLFYLYFTSNKFEKVTEQIYRGVDGLLEWFKVPAGVLFHQGHSWMRIDDLEPELVKIGMDDFAHKMVGGLELSNIPKPGATIQQGEKCWTVADNEKSVAMLSPISGKVVEMNPALSGNKDSTAILADDPYGAGWLLKVQPSNMEREQKNLLHDNLAMKWMEEVVDSLRMRMGAELGAVFQDGGVPMAGMAKNINQDNWDQLMHDFFLSRPPQE